MCNSQLTILLVFQLQTQGLSKISVVSWLERPLDPKEAKDSMDFLFLQHSLCT